MAGPWDDLPLSPYRVLDLSDERGLLCGRILADLGADVLRVEPPNGSTARKIGPFLGGTPSLEGSLYWWFYAANSRGITLDWSTAKGHALFEKLVASSHFLVESFGPGEMEAVGLGWKALHMINPSLVMVSITAFGQTGPRAGWGATDLTGMASSGYMHLTGDPKRPPLRVCPPQFYLHGSSSAAAGAMVAHFERRRSGRGQHVDVSCQQSAVSALSSAVPLFVHDGSVIGRQGSFRQLPASVSPVIWPCRDGHVCFEISVGPGLGRSIISLLKWMDEDGLGAPPLREVPWESLRRDNLTQELMDSILPPLQRWFLTHTKEELYRGALERRIVMFPVNSPADVTREDQLQARHYWQELSQDGRSVTYPGGFAWTSTWGHLPIRCAAPRLGQDNEKVYCDELGLGRAQVASLHKEGVV